MLVELGLSKGEKHGNVPRSETKPVMLLVVGMDHTIARMMDREDHTIAKMRRPMGSSKSVQSHRREPFSSWFWCTKYAERPRTMTAKTHCAVRKTREMRRVRIMLLVVVEKYVCIDGAIEMSVSCC